MVKNSIDLQLVIPAVGPAMISTTRLLSLHLLFSLIVCPVPTIAYRFLHSNWQVSEDCNGPPTTMTLFSAANPWNDQPDPGRVVRFFNPFF